MKWNNNKFIKKKKKRKKELFDDILMSLNNITLFFRIVFEDFLISLIII